MYDLESLPLEAYQEGHARLVQPWHGPKSSAMTAKMCIGMIYTTTIVMFMEDIRAGTSCWRALRSCDLTLISKFAAVLVCRQGIWKCFRTELSISTILQAVRRRDICVVVALASQAGRTTVNLLLTGLFLD